MRRSVLIGGAIVAGLYYLSQQGVSNTPGLGDPGDTNADGSAADGTDAGLIDEGIVMLNLVPDYINAWADRITQHEGWYPGSRSYRNNNPGNLEVDGDLGRDSGGYGVFSSYNAGRNALVADLTAKVRKYGSWTLYQVMARYAPPKENNTQAYADTVAAALGVTTATLVRDISSAWSVDGRVYQAMVFPSSDAQPQLASSASVPDPTMDSSLFTESITGMDPGLIDLSSFDPGDV